MEIDKLLCKLFYMINRIKYIFNYLLIFLVINCASQAIPSGGPEDISGPIIKSVHPENKSSTLFGKDKIQIVFNELLDGKLSSKLVRFHPDVKCNVYVKNNRLFIEPINEWPLNSSIEVTIGRELKDWLGNNINQSIQLIYNMQFSLYNSIEGRIYNSDKIIQLGLYEWPVNFDEDLPYKFVQSNSDGRYKFLYVPHGKYIIFATESNDFNPKINIRNANYGMSNSKYISIIDQDKVQNIFIDKPLVKETIDEIVCVNSNYYKFYISNLGSDSEVVDYFLDKNVTAGDTINFFINRTNERENYIIKVQDYIVPNVIDTIPPQIVSTYINHDSILVEFSEPIFKESFVVYNAKSKDQISNFKFINSNIVSIGKDSINSIKIYKENVKDLFNNHMLDSVKTITIPLNEDDDYIFSSTIKGIINSDDKQRLVVQATNIGSKKTYSAFNVGDSFSINNVEPGHYIVWAYSMDGIVDSVRYFSGTIIPYKPSSKFIFCKDTIEVRKNWDVGGVILDFEEE